MLWQAITGSVALLMLFVVGPAFDGTFDTVSSTQYRSTDFEVHRYWTAITHSLPAREWYTANHSIWTLDYPPLFAYFHWSLATTHSWLNQTCSATRSLPSGEWKLHPFPGRFLDPRVVLANATCVFVDEALVDVEAAYPFSVGIATFLKTSVVLASTLPFLVAVAWLSRATPAEHAGWFLVLATHPSLLLLDHVHFQYNGLVFAIALVAIGFAAKRRYVTAGAVYFVLLLTKHLFAYYGLGFAMWGVALLVVLPRAGQRVSLSLRFAMSGVAVFALTFAPLVLSHLETGMPVVDAIRVVLMDVKRRLFPFGRGLCHAYWAPNVYPLYNVLDRALVKFLGVPVTETSVNTKGHVGLLHDELHATLPPTHAVLPSLTPGVTILLVLVCFAALAAVVYRVTQRGPGTTSSLCWDVLVPGLFVSSVAFFSCSWHVHEKALVTVTVPALLLAASGRLSAEGIRALCLLSFATTAAVHPLFFTTRECVLKYICLVGHDAFTTAVANRFGLTADDHRERPVLARSWAAAGAKLLVIALSLVVDWNAIGARSGARDDRFAPLMIYSMTLSIVVLWAVVGIATSIVTPRRKEA